MFRKHIFVIFFLNAGYYCPEGSSVETQVICSSAKHCPTGSSVPQDCISGTFVDYDGGYECAVCPEGKNVCFLQRTKVFLLNGHRNADKRANSFLQFLHFFPRNSSCFYNVGRLAKSSDCLDTVLSVLKFIRYIGWLLGNIDLTIVNLP